MFSDRYLLLFFSMALGYTRTVMGNCGNCSTCLSLGPELWYQLDSTSIDFHEKFVLFLDLYSNFRIDNNEQRFAEVIAKIAQQLAEMINLRAEPPLERAIR